LQTIEDKTRAKLNDDEANKLAGDILGVIKEYQAEETHLDIKWGS